MRSWVVVTEIPCFAGEGEFTSVHMSHDPRRPSARERADELGEQGRSPSTREIASSGSASPSALLYAIALDRDRLKSGREIHCGVVRLDSRFKRVCDARIGVELL